MHVSSVLAHCVSIGVCSCCTACHDVRLSNGTMACQCPSSARFGNVHHDAAPAPQVRRKRSSKLISAMQVALLLAHPAALCGVRQILLPKLPTSETPREHPLL